MELRISSKAEQRDPSKSRQEERRERHPAIQEVRLPEKGRKSGPRPARCYGRHVVDGDGGGQSI